MVGVPGDGKWEEKGGGVIAVGKKRGGGQGQLLKFDIFEGDFYRKW